MKKQKVYYYHDMKNDDFATTNIETVKLPDDYKYFKRNFFYNFVKICLRLVVYPIIYLILKIGYGISFKNRRVLRKVKNQGYFLYGNHTNYMMDAYNPHIIPLPLQAEVVVNPDAVSIKGIKVIVEMLGAFPVPTSMKGMKNFCDSIEILIKKKHVITIYPEAHIWPCYTDIRPFGTESFHYPVNTNSPCFAFTNIYKKRIIPFIKYPKVVTYIDGPFYPDLNLGKKERIQKLRDEVYNAMKKRVDENPKYEYRKYVYVEDPSMSNAKNKAEK